MTDVTPPPTPRHHDPYNPHPASRQSTVDCPTCNSLQPVFEDPLYGARCARCASPVPVRPHRAPGA